MNEYDDLDELFGPLRSPATSAELAREDDIVDRMTRAHHSSKGPTMFTSRRARVATLIAAGIVGFGGVAAAGPAVMNVVAPAEPTLEDEPLDEPVETDAEEDAPESDGIVPEEETQEAEEKVVEDEDVEDEAPVVIAAVEALDPEDPDQSTKFDERDCLEGNHGKTVSAVARNLPPFEDVEVRDAAQSSCGKDIDELAIQEPEIEETETPELEETEVEETEPTKRTGKPDNAGKPAHANTGNGNGRKGG